ncbi:MAG: hypothetical protein ACREU3_16735, partial [Steroidobacteraceae bacterium]
MGGILGCLFLAGVPIEQTCAAPLVQSGVSKNVVITPQTLNGEAVAAYNSYLSDEKTLQRSAAAEYNSYLSDEKALQRQSAALEQQGNPDIAE